MKRMEKLADECSEKLWGGADRDDPPSELAVAAYLAGFREARAEIIQALKNADTYEWDEALILGVGEDEVP